jgi:hypothetical protein
MLTSRCALSPLGERGSVRGGCESVSLSPKQRQRRRPRSDELGSGGRGGLQQVPQVGWYLMAAPPPPAPLSIDARSIPARVCATPCACTESISPSTAAAAHQHGRERERELCMCVCVHPPHSPLLMHSSLAHADAFAFAAHPIDQRRFARQKFARSKHYDLLFSSLKKRLL